jgi:hypothetical protein
LLTTVNVKPSSRTMLRFPLFRKPPVILKMFSKAGHECTRGMGMGMGGGGGLKVLLTWIIRTVSFSQYTFTTHCIAG